MMVIKMTFINVLAVLVISAILTFFMSLIMYDTVRGIGHEQYLYMHGGLRGGVLG